MRRQVHMHSRSRIRTFHEAKRKGRHTGHGKRKGTKDSRMPQKILWLRRQRVLRRLLKKYRDAKKISKDIYHHFYLGSKGNLFKNKNVLIEAIHKMKQEKIREKQLEEQQEARRIKNQARKEKRINKQKAMMGEVKKPAEAAKEAPKKEEAAPKDQKKGSPAKKEQKKEEPKKEQKKDAKDQGKKPADKKGDKKGGKK